MNLEDRQWKYKIRSGKMPVILTLIMFSAFGGLTAWLYSTDNGAFIFTGLFSAILLALVIATVYRLAFFKVLIGKDRFYYQTGPSNGSSTTMLKLKKRGLIPEKPKTERKKITVTLRFPVSL